jgi:hypothetical protein
MKFKNLLKQSEGYGFVFKLDGDKWLFYNNVLAKVPAGYNVVCDLETNMPDWLVELLDVPYAEHAYLVGAGVPFPDSKPSELFRVFGDNENKENVKRAVLVPNKTFGMIERHNGVWIDEMSTDEHSYKFLFVTKDEYTFDDIEAVIFEENFRIREVM